MVLFASSDRNFQPKPEKFTALKIMLNKTLPCKECPEWGDQVVPPNNLVLFASSDRDFQPKPEKFTLLKIMLNKTLPCKECPEWGTQLLKIMLNRHCLAKSVRSGELRLVSSVPPNNLVLLLHLTVTFNPNHRSLRHCLAKSVRSGAFRLVSSVPPNNLVLFASSDRDFQPKTEKFTLLKIMLNKTLPAKSVRSGVFRLVSSVPPNNLVLFASSDRDFQPKPEKFTLLKIMLNKTLPCKECPEWGAQALKIMLNKTLPCKECPEWGAQLLKIMLKRHCLVSGVGVEWVLRLVSSVPPNNLVLFASSDRDFQPKPEKFTLLKIMLNKTLPCKKSVRRGSSVPPNNLVLFASSDRDFNQTIEVYVAENHAQQDIALCGVGVSGVLRLVSSVPPNNLVLFASSDRDFQPKPEKFTLLKIMLNKTLPCKECPEWGAQSVRSGELRLVSSVPPNNLVLFASSDRDFQPKPEKFTLLKIMLNKTLPCKECPEWGTQVVPPNYLVLFASSDHDFQPKPEKFTLLKIMLNKTLPCKECRSGELRLVFSVPPNNLVLFASSDLAESHAQQDIALQRVSGVGCSGWFLQSLQIIWFCLLHLTVTFNPNHRSLRQHFRFSDRAFGSFKLIMFSVALAEIMLNKTLPCKECPEWGAQLLKIMLNKTLPCKSVRRGTQVGFFSPSKLLVLFASSDHDFQPKPEKFTLLKIMLNKTLPCKECPEWGAQLLKIMLNKTLPCVRSGELSGVLRLVSSVPPNNLVLFASSDCDFQPKPEKFTLLKIMLNKTLHCKECRRGAQTVLLGSFKLIMFSVALAESHAQQDIALQRVSGVGCSVPPNYLVLFASSDRDFQPKPEKFTLLKIMLNKTLPCKECPEWGAQVVSSVPPNNLVRFASSDLAENHAQQDIALQRVSGLGNSGAENHAQQDIALQRVSGVGCSVPPNYLVLFASSDHDFQPKPEKFTLLKIMLNKTLPCKECPEWGAQLLKIMLNKTLPCKECPEWGAQVVPPNNLVLFASSDRDFQPKPEKFTLLKIMLNKTLPCKECPEWGAQVVPPNNLVLFASSDRDFQPKPEKFTLLKIMLNKTLPCVRSGVLRLVSSVPPNNLVLFASSDRDFQPKPEKFTEIMKKSVFQEGSIWPPETGPFRGGNENQKKSFPSGQVCPQKHEHVRTNALTEVLQRGGDVSDRLEVMGEYYKGKLYRWLLENDVSYTLYLMDKVEEEERGGTFNSQGPSKDSLLSFLDYARSFQEIEDLRKYLCSRKPAPPVASEGEHTVSFGARAKDTWKQIWDSRADGYAAFVLGVKCIINSKMYNLQQYILKQQRAESCPPPAEGCIASATSTLTSSTPVMEEDEELERGMLNLSPSKFYTERSRATSSSLQGPGCVYTNRTYPTATATVSRPDGLAPLKGYWVFILLTWIHLESFSYILCIYTLMFVFAFHPSATVKAPLPVPPQLLAIATKLGIEEQAPNLLRQNSSPHNMAPEKAQGDTAMKYIYCPSRVFSLYNAQGMEKELTWREFQQSDFYDAERDRWIADKRKP
ncbi:hypothetical protein F7725_028719 [Dissostichus mawsoni]|uniref:Uncharacterized protein n=1 Tax=Dissostichus mawsoni TaxID=36200 RepID=A0A7J5XGV0_DISMA|nr:hypothetical protein F7725_028719 [Dissostichus mawsoni]